jgi:ribose 5-phosphate isomerase B
MNIIIGNDHAGVDIKETIISFLKEKEIDYKNVGSDSKESVDYPDFAHPVASKVDQKEFEMGILICGSGNGVAMTANKYLSVRAALCWDEEIASLSRKHNNANILCLPARYISQQKALKIVKTFINESFEGERHERRINKI